MVPAKRLPICGSSRPTGRKVQSHTRFATWHQLDSIQLQLQLQVRLQLQHQRPFQVQHQHQHPHLGVGVVWVVHTGQEERQAPAFRPRQCLSNNGASAPRRTEASAHTTHTGARSHTCFQLQARIHLCFIDLCVDSSLQPHQLSTPTFSKNS